MKALLAAGIAVCLYALPGAAVAASGAASPGYPLAGKHWLWEPLRSLAPGSAGVQARARDRSGQRYTLQAGALALFRLPGDHWLRLSSGPGQQAAPAIWYSQGNGLFVPAQLQQSRRGKAWLLAPPVGGDIVVMLENNDTKTADWWLSKALVENSAESHAQRETPVAPANTAAWYQQRHRGSHLQLTRVQAGEQYRVSLTGPGAWRLEARTLADSAAQWQRFLDIPLRLDDQYWRDWRLHPSLNYRDTLVSGHCEMISSAAESLHLNLPEGEHTISFTAPADMAVRTLALPAEGFLFPHNRTPANLRADGDAFFPNSIAAAQPRYDEVLFAAFLNGELSPAQLPPQSSAIDTQMQPRYTAARLIDQRYRYWRPLPVANVVRAGGQFALLDVALADPARGTTRYLQQTTAPSSKTQTLLELHPGQTVALHTPDDKPQTTLKIALPLTKLPYDLALKNRRGDTTVWRWRPAFIQSGALGLVRDQDLALISTPGGSSEIPTAATTITFDREDFPVSLSHNAAQTVLFSPFYRQEVPRTLDQPGWERALEVLGRDRVLSLLLSDARPETGAHRSLEQRLELYVWHDWQPLRGWLNSYRKIWTRGLATQATGVEPPPSDQLALLIARLDGEASHLLEQLLRGIAVKDTNPLRQRQALEWLHSHYKKAGDAANLSAYHSWHFQHAPAQQLQATADWLVASGQDSMAVRLYRLAATSSDHLAYQQARLQAGWRQTENEPQALLAVWEAIWRQDWNRALSLSSRLGASHPWSQFLSQMPGDSDAVSWLQWADRAPVGDTGRTPLATAATLDVRDSAQSIYFHAIERDLHLQKALATPQSPVTYTVIGPLQVQLTLGLQHSDPRQTLSDWIEISANGSRNWFPLVDSTISPGLRQLPHPGDKYIGRQAQVTLALGPGRFNLRIKPLQHNVLVSARHLSPLLMAPLVGSLQRGHASPGANVFSTGELLKRLDIHHLGECANEVPEVSAPLAPIHSGGASAVSAVAEGRSFAAPHTLSALDISGSPGAEFDGDVEKYLLQLLWRWPHTGDREKRHLIARANAIASPFLEQDRVRTYLRKLNAGHSWRLEENITSSAGSRRISASGSSEHPLTTEREMLLFGGVPPAGERLHGYQQIGIFTRFREPTEIVFDLRQAHIPYREVPPASVALTVNDKPLRTVTLPPLVQQFSVTVDAGPQQLRLRLDQPTTDHWVYVQAHAEIDGYPQALLEEKTRRYQIATAQQPLEIFVPEPRWLRITEIVDGDTRHRFHYQPQPGYLRLAPKTGAPQAMYRVFGWQPASAEPALGPYLGDYASVGVQVAQPSPPPAEFILDTALPYDLYAELDNPAATNATDGFFLQLQSRRDFDADVSSDSSDNREQKDEQFVEAGWRHRQALDCLACYWRSDVYARQHADSGIALLGTDQRLEGRWTQSSWRWALQQSFVLQPGSGSDWSWLGAASLTETHAINEKMEHEYSVQAFGRYLATNDTDQPLDNDIYTRYKDQHRHGVKLGTALRGRPWLDSKWAVEAALASNEDFNPLQPDYVQAAISWRQYWRPLAFSAAYRHRLYLSDDDRRDSAHRPQLRLAVNSMVGFQAGRILQWALNLDYDLEHQDFGVALSFNWDNTRGRGLRDYQPRRSSFHSLRSREISASHVHRQSLARADHGQ